ncbi:MAG: hypothetical protein D6801_06215 [Alphaproteobacteria bacterium]|nr:MAG: hypothetical protein D6801_06215 [Alphaproteobacteria bacterium]
MRRGFVEGRLGTTCPIVKGDGDTRIFGFSLAEDLSAFSGIATVSFAKKGFGTLVKVDADNNGTVDFHIKVMHVNHLTQDDFIF